ncbi:MAG TPA: class I SAM-dependent DNA methyltransferase [Ktedonobacteraceae bacterium]
MTISQQPSLFDSGELPPSKAEASNGDDNGTRSRQQKGKAPLSSKQQLSTTIKSVRDLLRKDAGLSGDTDRLPQLTWLLFLKNLDDFERREEALRRDYQPMLDEEFRWQSWVVDQSVKARKTGDELISFVNGELFPHLRGLPSRGEGDLRAVISTIFQDTTNRIRSGYILREVVDKLNNINFNSSDDIHSVSLFYETMLKEMRDAAGDSGEFYTPRPVVRFIIDRLKPRLGERVLDPACGTGGFLVEAYEHLKDEPKTAAQVQQLYKHLLGIEKKPMPYLLGVMNMLLHGIPTPNLREANALATNIGQIDPESRVDVIATNPPFGGEEERSILENFPPGGRTAETALLFFQYVMAMLKRPGGRCGLVLPNGFLFGGGAASTIKKQLLAKYNLHTIVRLPNGVFAPYTSIPANLLFFDACAESEELDAPPCTPEVWFYEIPLPEGRRSYSKTKAMQYEEFADCSVWWDAAERVENEHAWRVPYEEIAANDFNLDRKNPASKVDYEHLPPAQLVASIMQKETRIMEIMGEIKQLLGEDEG